MTGPSKLVQAMVDGAAAASQHEEHLLPTKAQSMECLDGLRKQVEAGEIVAFFAFGVTGTDDLRCFLGHSRPISQLRMLGAAHLAIGMLESPPKAA